MSDVRDRMQETMRHVLAVMPPNTGVVILAFDFGESGRLEYSSNAKRGDVLNAMREFIAHATKANWMKHTGEGPPAPGN